MANSVSAQQLAEQLLHLDNTPAVPATKRYGGKVGDYVSAHKGLVAAFAVVGVVTIAVIVGTVVMNKIKKSKIPPVPENA